MSETKKIVALIPARSGSKRIPRKNIKLLKGHPLIAYTIRAALESAIFQSVIVSTDSEEIAAVARHYGATVPLLRPVDLAGSESPDIEWVDHILQYLEDQGQFYDCFSILRPTSPLRSSLTIKNAWNKFLQNQPADSLRAIEKCSQHPAKMWTINPEGTRMVPVMVNPDSTDVPWHSKQYPSLPLIYVQNASLEIAWTQTPKTGKGIAGDVIIPFISEGFDGFDLNFNEDWHVLENLLTEGIVTLPDLS